MQGAGPGRGPGYESGGHHLYSLSIMPPKKECEITLEINTKALTTGLADTTGPWIIPPAGHRQYPPIHGSLQLPANGHRPPATSVHRHGHRPTATGHQRALPRPRSHRPRGHRPPATPINRLSPLAVVTRPVAISKKTRNLDKWSLANRRDKTFYNDSTKKWW